MPHLWLKIKVLRRPVQTAAQRLLSAGEHCALLGTSSKRIRAWPRLVLIFSWKCGIRTTLIALQLSRRVVDRTLGFRRVVPVLHFRVLIIDHLNSVQLCSWINRCKAQLAGYSAKS